MDIRSRILILLNKICPINLQGDAKIQDKSEYDLSCIINFYGRTHLLKNILSCLVEQNIDQSRFEVVLVEDKGGTEDGANIAEEYSNCLNINYITLKQNFGIMGYSRNIGTEHSNGNYILFLDDDTIILQRSFLTNLVDVFQNEQIDGVMPFGQASFCVVKDRYQYHDSFFPTNRCMAYSRHTLQELKGFKSTIIGHEDVEFAMRLTLSKKNIIVNKNLEYFHPPLIQHNFSKSASVGLSYYNLKKSYPFIIWILLLINGCRYIPYGLLAFKSKFLNQFKFSIGFLLGIIYGIKGKKVEYK
jgi:GT2 family glycosyltransferase